MGKENPSGQVKLIKRYRNRKLYDTESSRYITLAEITRLIRKGKEIRVMDNNSGEDLTSLTLSQIILEQGRKRRPILPIAVLRRIIQAGGESIAEFIDLGRLGFPKKFDEQVNEIMARITGMKKLEQEVQILARKVRSLERSVKRLQPGSPPRK